jgi:hypothetical protein
MRGEQEPATSHPDDDADEWFDGARVEPIASGARTHSGASGSAAAPDWTRRLSARGKLARALIVALAVIVALIALLAHSNYTLPPQIGRLLTPAPTQTPTPGNFTAGPLEQISLPAVPGATTAGVTPSARDPATAYTCMFPVSSDPNSKVVSGEISLWVTHDVGRSWSRAALPSMSGTNCYVETAQDSSPRMTMVVSDHTLDQSAQPCAHDRFLFSDDGETWRPIRHATLAQAAGASGECELWATARHLFMTTYTYGESNQTGPTQSRSYLERSDDGGASWLRADHGMEGVGTTWFAQSLDGTSDGLITLVSKYDNGIVTQSDLWMTRDAGATWRHVGPVAPNTPPASAGVSFLLTEAGRGDGAHLCHCAFGVTTPYGGSPIAGQHIYRTTDFARWTPLPPIPVKGTSAARSGVYLVLATTADGKLVAMGADPTTGVAEMPDHNGRVSGLSPALWAWNTRSGRWEVAQTAIPCVDVQTCFFYGVGVSVGAGTSGKPQGTYIWISFQVGSGVDSPPVLTYYRLFIPAT